MKSKRNVTLQLLDRLGNEAVKSKQHKAFNTLNELHEKITGQEEHYLMIALVHLFDCDEGRWELDGLIKDLKLKYLITEQPMTDQEKINKLVILVEHLIIDLYLRREVSQEGYEHLINILQEVKGAGQQRSRA